MDALFGAFRAYLEGTFTDRVFAVSFISNVLIAAAIVYVGDQIGVGSQLATGVVVVLGIRIFTNAAAIRRRSSMPEGPPLESTTHEPPARHRRRHVRSRSAVSRRIGSLRRSQRRLAGEEHPSTPSTDHPPDQPPVAQRPDRTEDAHDVARSTRDRLRASLRHPGRAQILAAIILFVVGAAGVMQIKSNAAGDTYASARREDLIQLLDGLSEESRRLEGEIAQLEQTRAICSQARIPSGWPGRGAKALRRAIHPRWHGPAQGPGNSDAIADPKDAVDSRGAPRRCRGDA
jgi:hypothetical protein